MQTNLDKSAMKIAILNYAGTAFFAAIVGFLAYFLGDSANLIVLKVVFAPFFLLANRSLPTFFKDKVDMHGFNAKSVETQILSALLIAGYFMIIMWRPDKSVGLMMSDFLIMFLTMSIAHMAVLAFRASKAKLPQD